MYEVYTASSAERDLKKLPPDVFRRIVPEIKLLADNPRPSGARKIVGSEADWRIRIGDYRVIYEIRDEIRIVRVMRVRHRRDAYR